jgi:two-component system NtrC family sensor kinase
MNIAIVGGGTQCSLLLDMIEKNPFQELHPKIVAVADERDDAPGIVKAREKGIFVTKDYNDFFERDDIELIIEVAGSQEIFFDIVQKKKRSVRAFDNRTAQLFWEVSRVANIQHKTDLELQKTRTMYEVIINDLIQEDVMVIGADYGILDINESMLKKLGLTHNEVIGKHCYEISHRQPTPCRGDKHPCPLIQTINTKKSSQTTHVHLDKDKRELYFSISCYPIFQGDEVIAAVEISKDITSQINMQKLMMQQEKLVSIGRLAAGVAHEINNPMTTILTTAMLIQEDLDPDDPNYRELQTIADETLRCRKIVTSLLDFARQRRPEKKESSINDIVRESISLVRKQAAFKDIRIESMLSEHIPHIDVDRDQIQQAIINLALNAIEATEAGGEVSFETRLNAQEKVIEIAIADTGHGIAEEDLHKIFEPFFTTKETGTGLGMAISHGLIEQHGGTVAIESEVNRGTTFTIRLPISKGNNDAN